MRSNWEFGIPTAQRKMVRIPANPSAVIIKLTRTNVGVDAGEFRLVSRGERRESIGRLAETIAGMERGKRAEQSNYLAEHLRDDLSIEEVHEVLAASAAYLKQRPDADAEAKLERIDWDRDGVVAYVPVS